MGASQAASRVLLEGDTLRIGFHGVGKASYPEDVPVAAVMRAMAQRLRVELGTQGVFWGDYCYFAGVTGEAFRFLQFMGLGEKGDRPLVEQYGRQTAEAMYREAFQAAGLEAEIFLRPALPDRATLERMIVESLRDRGTPVVGFGVFGPPEPFLVTGYDDGGEVLLGWSHFQAERAGHPGISFEPSGQFRLARWYEAVLGIAVVTGTAGRRLEPRAIYRGAIERALGELRSRGTRAAPLGSAAMERWAEHLESESDFAGFSDEKWRKAHSDHSVTAGDFAERRALAASFLELARRELPEAAPDLEGAQASFQGSHDTVYEIWETVARSGPFDPDIAKFRDPDRRRLLAGLVRRLVELDRRGLAFLERALRVVDGKEAGPELPAEPLLDGTVALEKAPAPAAGEPQWAP